MCTDLDQIPMQPVQMHRSASFAIGEKSPDSLRFAVKALTYDNFLKSQNIFCIGFCIGQKLGLDLFKGGCMSLGIRLYKIKYM